MLRRIACLLLLLLSGCVDTRPAVEPTSDFDAQTLGRGMTPGTSSIVGQASWVTEKGIRHYAIGATVTLWPSTPYVAECARNTSKAKLQCADLLKPYARSTTTDKEGRFMFAGLHQGSYFLTTDVCWAGGRRRLRPCHTVQGEAVIQREAQTVEIVL